MPSKKNPRNAPIDRFIWKEGDVKIIHVPTAKKRIRVKNDGSRRGSKDKEESG